MPLSRVTRTEIFFIRVGKQSNDGANILFQRGARLLLRLCPYFVCLRGRIIGALIFIWRPAAHKSAVSAAAIPFSVDSAGIIEPRNGKQLEYSRRMKTSCGIDICLPHLRRCGRASVCASGAPGRVYVCVVCRWLVTSDEL